MWSLSTSSLHLRQTNLKEKIIRWRAINWKYIFHEQNTTYTSLPLQCKMQPPRLFALVITFVNKSRDNYSAKKDMLKYSWVRNIALHLNRNLLSFRQRETSKKGNKIFIFIKIWLKAFVTQSEKKYWQVTGYKEDGE